MTAVATPLSKPTASVSPWTDAWRRFKRHRLAFWSVWLLAALALAVLLGPLFYKVGINDIDFKQRLAPPSAEHWMGTDDLGHRVEPFADSYQDYGAGQFIWRLGDPAVEGYAAASDPRRDGQAAGY